MAESSFPVVGEEFPDDQWTQTQEGASGVLDDWGDPYNLTVNTDDTATIGLSSTGTNRAVVAGHGHLMDATVNLSFPAVTSTTTYTAGLLYDVAGGSDPVTLQVLTALPTDGSVFLPLYTCVRASGQTLSAATWSDVRPRLAPRLVVATEAAGRASDPAGFLRGTILHALDTGADLVADVVSGSKAWKRTNTITRSGTFYGTVAAGGGTPIAHGLGTAPDAVALTMMNHPTVDTNARLFEPILWGVPGASTFSVRAVDRRDNTWASGNQSLRFMWTAVADPE